MVEQSDSLLDNGRFPDDLKTLSQQQLITLCDDIRHRLIEVTNAVGGHLASNLGVVELTVAMHTIFDSPTDAFFWDTSHQTYVHKMLTGRLRDMYTIKQYGGLSGFAKIKESEHDFFGAGHASTSLSAALGMAHARNAQKKDHNVVCVVGDSGLSGGMAYEALNNMHSLNGNFVCILNDNNMSISPPVGAMSQYITSIRSSKLYDDMTHRFRRAFHHIPSIGQSLYRRVDQALRRFRSSLLLDDPTGVLFEEFGFKYLGPIDGHNVVSVMTALRYAKEYNGPIMIHVITKKGKGMATAEKNPVKYHGVSPQPADSASTKKKRPTFTQCFGQEIVRIAQANDQIHVVTPAMREGSGLVEFEQQFPDRYYDVGIAEEHAVTFCAGLAKGGVMPVLAIYSTFLQRGFDQMIHDVCLQELPLVLAIDRGGLVGADGPTHHGVFDLAYLTMIPNMIVCAPKDGTELQGMLQWAVTQGRIVSIRYPRGSVPAQDGEHVAPIHHGQAQVLVPPSSDDVDVLLVGVGHLAWPAVTVARDLAHQGIQAAVVNLRFIKPLDTATLEPLIQRARLVCVMEDGCQIGGAFHYILNQCRHMSKSLNDWISVAIPDRFVDHGTVNELYQELGMTPQQITAMLIERLGT